MAEVPDRARVVAEPHAQHPREVAGVHVVRPAREHRVEQPRRVLEPAVPVQREGLRVHRRGRGSGSALHPFARTFGEVAVGCRQASVAAMRCCSSFRACGMRGP